MEKKYELEIAHLGAYIGVNNVYVHNIEELLLTLNLKAVGLYTALGP